MFLYFGSEVMIASPITEEISEGSRSHQLFQEHREVFLKKRIDHGTKLGEPLVNGSLARAE
jgi:hypothetical protein